MSTWVEVMGFDAGAIAEEAVTAVTTGGTVTETATGARNGTCLRVNRTSAAVCRAGRDTSTTPSFPSGKSTGAMVVYLKFDTLPSANIEVVTLSVFSGNDADLYVDAAGALTLKYDGGVASPTVATLVAGTWYRVEVRWDHTTTTHTAHASVDGGTEQTATRAGTAGVVVNGWRIGSSTTTAATYDLKADDLGFVDGNARVNKTVAVRALAPDSDVDSVWSITGGDASRFAAVDERPNDPATYINSTTSGAVQRLGLATYTLTGTEVVEAVTFAGNAGSDGTSGTRNMTTVAQDGTATDAGTTAVWSASINGVRFNSAVTIYNLAPGGGAWSQSELNGLRFKATKSATSDLVRLHNVWAYAVVTGDPSSGGTADVGGAVGAGRAPTGVRAGAGATGGAVAGGNEVTDLGSDLVGDSEGDTDSRGDLSYVPQSLIGVSTGGVQALGDVTLTPQPEPEADCGDPGPLGWLVFGGQEIANDARVLSYLANGQSPENPDGVPGVSDRWNVSLGDCCPCPVLLTDGSGNPTPFLRPDASVLAAAGDPAPWYEPDRPESAEFLGVWVESITGLDSVVSRSVVERGSQPGGGFLGVERQSVRQVVVRATLIATSCVGLDYGRQWLSHTLANDPCDLCESYALEVRTTCPKSSAPPVSDVGLKTLYDVGLTEGPKRVEQGGATAGPCDYLDVEFTLTAGDPWLYECPVECLPRTQGDSGDVGSGEDVYEWQCTFDPPTPFGVTGLVVTIETSGVGDSPAADEVTIEGWTVDPILGCDEAREAGGPCYSLTLANLPRRAIVVLDGSRRRLTIREDNGLGPERDALPYVVLGSGDGYEWPESTGCLPTCVVVSVPADSADRFAVSIDTRQKFVA